MIGNQRDYSEGEQFDVVLEDVETGVRPRKIKGSDTKKNTTGNGWQYASLAGEVGFDVALPMVAGLIAGVKLDERFGTKPRATMVLFALGLFLSCASLIRIVRDVMHKR